jgi:N-acetylglutamate synthase-like GNAT family acetyltransferase
MGPDEMLYDARGLPTSEFTRVADLSDAPAITALINAAFVVERFFLERERITLEEVRGRFSTGQFLLLQDSESIAGCVYLEPRGERAYLGLLSVDPTRQKQGLSRRLMEAAEDHCRSNGRRFIDLTVVNLREELPGYYRHLGYVECGTSPFTAGVPTTRPCHLINMTKELF